MGRDASVRRSGGARAVSSSTSSSSRTGRTDAYSSTATFRRKAPAALDIVVENFQAADLAALTQTDLDFRGLVTTTARIEGTTAAPRFRAALGIANATYGGAAVPDLRATANYAAPSLTVHLEAADSGRRVAVADGTIPLNLGLRPQVARCCRTRPSPLTSDPTDFRSTSCHGSLISWRTCEGRAFGVVRVRGTTRHPSTVGALALQNGSIRLVSTGMRLTNVNGSHAAALGHGDHRFDRRTRRRPRARTRRPRHSTRSASRRSTCISRPTTRACSTTITGTVRADVARRRPRAVQPRPRCRAALACGTA